MTRDPEPATWRPHANYQILRTCADLIAGARCADLGCNHGSCTLLMHDFSPASVHGFDLNESALTVARQMAAAQGFAADRTRFVGAQLTDLRAHAADGAYDLVVSFHTLEHIYPEDADRVVAEMWRITRAGGHALLSIPYDHAYPDPCHVAFYTEDTLRALFERHGWRTRMCFRDERWSERDLLTALFFKTGDDLMATAG